MSWLGVAQGIFCMPSSQPILLFVQLNAVKEQSGELAEEAKSTQRERDRWVDHLRRLDDAKMQRLNALEAKTRGITNAHNWLQRPEVGAGRCAVYRVLGSSPRVKAVPDSAWQCLRAKGGPSIACGSRS